VPEDVLAAVRQHFSDRQVIDMSMLSAYYIGSGAVITAFAPDQEPPHLMQLELDWQKRRLKALQADPSRRS
jgi:hypothetical protein